MAKIDEDKLKAIISRELSDAKLFYRSDMEQQQRRALDYYDGVLNDTPPDDGWSSVVSKDVSDVIGWALPSIVRVFTASDRIVDFQPMQPGDEDFTEQASDTINYDFWTTNNGYRVMWDSTHDALLLGDGIVKTWWDDAKKYQTSVHSGLSAEQLGILTDDDDIEILEQKEGEGYEEPGQGEGMPGPDGQMMQPQMIEVPTYDVKIKRVTSYGCLRVKAIERGNFFIDRDALTIEDARFVSQRDPRMTRSELIRMGFDRKTVYEIPRFTGTQGANQDDLTRDNFQPGFLDSPDESTEPIELHECYLRMDVNNDGIAETIRAYYAGHGASGVLLEWEEYDDEVPFNQIPCTPVPHRFCSDSLANEVIDIQQIKTTLIRQALNNTYQVNNPQKDVVQDSIINMDEVVNPTVGGVILRKAGSEPVNYSVVPSILPNVLEAVAAMDRMIEWRTGISRATQALDPETLQNQSATAAQIQKDASYSQIELIARNMAELGWKRVFSKALRITVKHQDRERTIRLRDKWVEVDPRQWNSDMDAVVNTGLGTGSRDRDLMMLQQVSMQQEKLALAMQQSGMADLAIDMLQKIVKTSIKGAEAAGLRNAADYFIQIDDQKAGEMKQSAQEMAGKPDPKVEAETQAKQAELQMKQQEMQSNMQLKTQQMQMEYQLKLEQIKAEIQLKREQMQAELQLKQEMGFVDGLTKGASLGAGNVRMGGDVG